mgnify:CR=1 FL=1
MSERVFNRISVIGLGYIGLPTAAMFASRGIEVVGVDVNPHTVETINRGEIHIVEPELDAVVQKVVNENKLRATLAPEPADAFLIAVPTPFKGDNHDPDLSYIEAAAGAIAPVLSAGNLVVLESTSPVGATERMAAWLAERRPDLTFPTSHGEGSDIRVAHCPERVLPGKVMQELILNDRVVGGITQRCSREAATLYKTFVEGDCVIASNTRVAEMAKLTENSFRDVNIAFANELANVCSSLDMNVWEVIQLANRHPRVNILKPGPGVGGHCIAVDPWFIVAAARQDTPLIQAARTVNDGRPERVLGQIQTAASDFYVRNGRRPVIALLGLSFKPDIDDLRESPAVEVAHLTLASKAGTIIAVEPHIEELPRGLRETGLELVSLDIAVERADIAVMLVNHQAFSDVSSALFGGKDYICVCRDANE